SPLGMGAGALLADGAPGLQHVVGNLERAVIPAQRLLGAGKLFGTERLAMGLVGAGLVRRAVADGGLAGDHRGTVGGLRLGDGGSNRLLVLAVDVNRIPAVSLEPRYLVDIVG